jgi:hypothetical protein
MDAETSGRFARLHPAIGLVGSFLLAQLLQHPSRDQVDQRVQRVRVAHLVAPDG